jgi:hypothetical protein
MRTVDPGLRPQGQAVSDREQHVAGLARSNEGEALNLFGVNPLAALLLIVELRKKREVVLILGANIRE